jgi:hypothetical protein
MTLRYEVERSLGVLVLPTNEESQMHLKKKIRIWFLTTLAFMAISFVAGVIAGIIERIYP